MEIKDGYFINEYKINFTQLGIYGKLTNQGFLNIMENIADDHSVNFHMTFKDLEKDNVTWAILNWKLEIFSRPLDSETVKVQTWGRFFNKLYVLRDFKFYRENGDLAAIATSKWCLINTKTHKLEMMYEDLDSRYGSFPEESVFGIQDLPKLPLPTTNVSDFTTFTIRRSDLDLNKHVHNVNYLDFAYEVLPEEIFFDKELNNVEIAYKKELNAGQNIKVELYVSEEPVIHSSEKEEIEYDKLKEMKQIYTILIKSEDGETLHSIIKLY